MELSPEEKRKIYEEEKARTEAERRERVTGARSSIGLEPNTAGLLCYLGFWITGIIFLVIEQDNKFVRFHALQSIVAFGALGVLGVIVSWIPFVGAVFGSIIGILVLVLWVFMMVKAHEGELFRLPLAGLVAEGVLPVEWRTGRPGTGVEQEEGTGLSQTGEDPELESMYEEKPLSTSSKQRVDRDSRRWDDAFRGTRVAGYSVAIVFNVLLLMFFAFFHRYIAFYYSGPGGDIIRVPILTEAYFTFLPILATALVMTIAAYFVLIIYDRYPLREIIQIVLAAIGVAVMVNLIAIFPFDFGGIRDEYAAGIMPSAMTIIFVVVAVALGISALVRFVKLMVTVAR